MILDRAFHVMSLASTSSSVISLYENRHYGPCLHRPTFVGGSNKAFPRNFVARQLTRHTNTLSRSCKSKVMRNLTLYLSLPASYLGYHLILPIQILAQVISTTVLHVCALMAYRSIGQLFTAHPQPALQCHRSCKKL